MVAGKNEVPEVPQNKWNEVLKRNEFESLLNMFELKTASLTYAELEKLQDDGEIRTIRQYSLALTQKIRKKGEADSLSQMRIQFSPAEFLKFRNALDSVVVMDD